MRSRHALFTAAMLVSATVSPRSAESAGTPKLSLVREGGELVLYDAAAHGTDVMSNGTMYGGNLRPVPVIVRKAGKTYAEFSYTGKGGRGRTLFWYEPLLEPAEGRRYAGIKLTIDYDRADYAKVDAMAHFRDGSQVGQKPLTLTPGEHEYEFTHAFRRAKWPIAWDQLDWIQLSVRSVTSEGNPIKWRLRKMVMLERESKRQFRELRITQVSKPQEVTNRGPLAAGEIKVLSIRRADNADREWTGDFRVDCTLRRFRGGAYRAQWRLDGGEVEPQQEAITLSAGRETTKAFAIRSARNRNGLYAFHLTLTNARNEARAWTVEFVNSLHTPDLFGTRLLSPRPKRVEWRQGEFAARQHAALFLPGGATARTLKTAEIFRRKYHDHTGVTLTTKRFGAVPPRRGLILRLARTAVFNGTNGTLRRDGYCLNVGKERVLITGGDERGLYYGMITFFQLMKNDFRVREHMPVPCVEILDWPDLPNRMMMAGHGGAWHYMKYGERRDIDYLIDWVDRFVAQNKANVFYVDLATAIISERRPEFGGKSKLYTLDQLRKLGRFCRDSFVEVCPAWQVGGHANWWLLGLHPELREKGYRNQSDVTHPEHNKIVFDVMRDTIEALGCKYATPKGDEWWHKPKNGEKRQDTVRGLTRAERYLDFQTKCRNFLKRNGVRMLLFDDMISPYHNGQRQGSYKRIDRYPKDIIICNWGPAESIAWFRKHGFEVWRTPNGGGSLSSKYARQVNGFGNIIYGLGSDGIGLRDHYNSMQSTYSLCRAADIGWNAYDYPGDEPGRAVSLRNLFALKSNGQAGARSAPLDLTGCFTHPFNAYLRQVKPEKYGDGTVPVRFKSGIQNIAYVPMRLASWTSRTGRTGAATPVGRDCIILREKSEGVTIPVNARYASLVFLHTSFINNFKDKRGRPGMNRKWPYGFPVGRYVVHYADGETETLPVRLTLDIRRFDTSSKNRATNNNRYVYVVDDCDYDPVHLFQWEWVNPRPHKTIAKVVAEHENKLDVSLILFAITGREAWK